MTSYSNRFLDMELPDPLTPEETLTYLKAYREGDQNARDIIVKHNIRLVFHRVSVRFKTPYFEQEELKSVGLMALIKCIDNFDIHRDVPFYIYLSKYVDFEILGFMNTNKNNIKTVNLDEMMEKEERQEGRDSLFNFSINDDFTNLFIEQETVQRLWKIILSMPDREKEILLLYLGYENDTPYTQVEIVKELKKWNLNQPTVSRILKRTIEKVREQFYASEENNHGTEKKLNKKRSL